MNERKVLLGALCALGTGLAYACTSYPEIVIPSDDFDKGTGASSMGGGGPSGAANNTAGIEPSSGNGSGGTSSNGSGTTAGGEAGAAFNPEFEYPDTDFEYDPLEGNGETCATVEGEAGEVKRPIDIIVSIDNSSSMSQEIEAVQERINDDFAAILEDSGIDYRVILVTRYGWVEDSVGGSNHPVCIGPPLGVASCTDDGYPMLELNPPNFYHHSTDIESRNMWCRLLSSLDSSDEVESSDARDSGDPHFPWAPVAPDGWREWLREGSFKVFVGITDDRPGGNGCDQFGDSLAGAQAWDEALRSLAPEHFGPYSADDPDEGRNYAWYSIVGMEENSPATEPWPPTEGIVNDTCPEGVAAGVGYQHLSIMTDALRYPNCLNNDFDAVFNAIAQGVIDRSQVPCEFEFPEVEGIIDPSKIQVSYVPGGSSSSQAFDRVADAGACSGEQVYFDDNDAPTKVLLCPDACALVQADEGAKISLDFGCLGS